MTNFDKNPKFYIYKKGKVSKSNTDAYFEVNKNDLKQIKLIIYISGNKIEDRSAVTEIKMMKAKSTL